MATPRRLPLSPPLMFHAVLSAALLLAAHAAVAQTGAGARSLPPVADLDPGLPAEVEDAFALPPGQRRLLLPLVIDHERDGDNRWVLEPRLQWGLVPGLQTTVAVPFVIGSGDRTNSGTLRGELMYQMLDERGGLPALAVLGRLDLPTGNNADGIDSAVKLLASYTLGARPGTHQIHLNAAVRHNSSRRPGERDETWRWVVGWSTLLTDRTSLVADVRRGHDREGFGRAGWVYEFGLRQVLAGSTVVAVGVGVGDGPDQPSWRIGGGLQMAF